MLKKEFIGILQQKGEYETKAIAEKALKAFIETLEEVFIKEEEITFSGFGKFEVKSKEARIGRNPQTGKEITLPPKKVIKFKSSTKLEEKINIPKKKSKKNQKSNKK